MWLWNVRGVTPPCLIVKNKQFKSVHIGKVRQKIMATKWHDSNIPLQNHTSATLEKGTMYNHNNIEWLRLGTQQEWMCVHKHNTHSMHSSHKPQCFVNLYIALSFPCVVNSKQNPRFWQMGVWAWRMKKTINNKRLEFPSFLGI
jgi:hypothetical protein